MHRFFLVDTKITPGQSVDLSPLSHQLSRVLRLKPGDRICLLDGDNAEYGTEIVQLDRRAALGLVRSRSSIESEPAIHLTLYQCSLKADKFEWVLQKGTELGVGTFVPVISQRSIVRPADALLKKHDRWQSVIREAAEQSGRGRLPELRRPLSYAEAVRDAVDDRYLPWEAANMQDDPCALGQSVRERSCDQPSISLMIGPEGGLAADEMTLAAAAGWHVVTLGPRILRAETAALASIAIVLDHLAELGQFRHSRLTR